ncbi:hypothetical protein PsorP6_011669 [Peronosclerospora sorghi]|uniref:Uncharacterized protein n=1 Tax=Peronosclerospora sorghi TaxID=230839 RepID=A0ACC0WIC4_9STRA|nr:hypothetical protein PsorP6_011669 [Peronosclerospora sorghi]
MRYDVNEGAARTLDRLKNLRVLAAAKKKDLVIPEVGWSSSGSDPDASVASPVVRAKFFADFYHVARTQGLNYYWFIAFDSKWQVTNGGKEVEADFGVFQENDVMKSNFQTLTDD